MYGAMNSHSRKFKYGYKTMKITLLLIALIISPFISASEYIWTYSGATLNNQWTYHSGNAKFEFNNRLFTAKLFDSEYSKFQRYTIKGKVIEDRVFATLTIHNSDSDEIKLEGTILQINSTTVFQLSDGISFFGIKNTAE